MRSAIQIYICSYRVPFLASCLIAAILCLLLIATATHAAPKADLWERWEAHDPGSSLTVDHRTWDALLGKYLVITDPSGINLFRYDAVTTLDRAALEMYLDELQRVKVSALSRLEQKAYWINLYNALAANTILEHYPVDSIRDIDISPGLFSNGPWDAKLLIIEGQQISLNDIEHRILRPIWKDPRVHYIVNCVAMGCPNLQNRAFVPEEMDQVLNEAAESFINHPRGVTVDENGKMTLSSIYKWFGEDFGNNIYEILEHLRGYASDDLKGKIPTDGKVKVKYRYDWDLNDAK
jgi:hypothetical protein